MQTTTSTISKETIQICRRKLILMREELLNHLRGHKLEVTIEEKMSGDEVDQALAQATENDFARQQSRLRARLMEIDYALARVQSGEFGVCEETQEPIEPERLLALPYTRLSIEGAEIREATQKRFAR